MSDAFRLARGASVLPQGGVRFSVWAPAAQRVSVRVPGNGPPTPLEHQGEGVFAGTLPDAAAACDYLYLLDDRLERPDPVSRHQPAGVHGPSRTVDPGAFRWSDPGWSGVERADLVLYELHVGTFSERGTFDGAIEHLERLRELGITALELMPVAEFPGTRNWGYDGVFPYAPQSSYGGPEGLRRLVDAAHGLGLAVLLDVVYNHLGPEGNVLGDFGPYFTDRHRTPWGRALNFDGPESDEVRRYFCDNARYWLDEYHLDGLRLDAVHAIHDASARPFLAELAAAVRELEGGLERRLHLIAESDANDPRLVRDSAGGGLGLDAVWSDDFHHAVHAALTGEREGYYVDFGGCEPLARALSNRFVHDGSYSRHRRRRHGAPARDVPADRFVVFVQNHDQVGNRALGERLSVLLRPARLRLAAALLLLAPYVPLLFMGEEYGETNPFLYFVGHGDPDLIAAAQRGRREEFAAFEWSGELPDPADPRTLERSRLRHARAGEPGHAELHTLYRDLLRARREEPALRPGRAVLRVEHDAKQGWILARYGGERAALAAFHLGVEAARIPDAGDGGPWSLRLATDDAAYGGPGRRAPARLEAGPLPLPPETALLYVREPH